MQCEGVVKILRVPINCRSFFFFVFILLVIHLSIIIIIIIILTCEQKKKEKKKRKKKKFSVISKQNDGLDQSSEEGDIVDRSSNSTKENLRYLRKDGLK